METARAKTGGARARGPAIARDGRPDSAPAPAGSPARSGRERRTPRARISAVGVSAPRVILSGARAGIGAGTGNRPSGGPASSERRVARETETLAAQASAIPSRAARTHVMLDADHHPTARRAATGPHEAGESGLGSKPVASPRFPVGLRSEAMAFAGTALAATELA